MSPSQIELSSDMQVEIERHKYFLSENAGHDVGWEAAEKDWLENHAPKPVLDTAVELDSPSEPQQRVDSPSSEQQTVVPAPKGVGGFFKRLLNKAK